MARVTRSETLKKRTKQESDSEPEPEDRSESDTKPELKTKPKLETKLQGVTKTSSRLTSEPKPRATSRSSPKVKPCKPDALEIAIEEYKRGAESLKRVSIKDVEALKRKFKQTCDSTKREAQKLEQKNAARKPARTNRSGMKRGVKQKAEYSDGRYIIMGIDDSQGKYKPEELNYLAKNITSFKEIEKIPNIFLKYLVVDVFLNDLLEIKSGKIKSIYHDRFAELKGKSKSDLMCEVRTGLFTNEQRDYVFGLLQGAFKCSDKDEKGDIKHSDIDYVNLVMVAEVTLRIVKFIHKIDTDEEAIDFMTKKSREALGLDDDDDDED